MSSRYIVRHPDRPHTYAMFHDEHGWVWTERAADATSYMYKDQCGLAAMEVELTHGIDCRGCVADQSVAIAAEQMRRWQENLRNSPPPRHAVDLPEVRIPWTPEMLADEDRWARRRLGGAS